MANLSPQEQLAQTAWIKLALPALKTGTCNTCHAGQMATAPAYLAGDKDLDIRDTMVAFIPSVVSLGSPKTSPVVLKGMHEGPAMTADEISGVLTWVGYEQGARGSGAEIETAKAPPAPCTGAPGGATCATPTTVDLTAVGSPGSTVTFFAQQIVSDLYLQQLTVTAGPNGLHLVHPIFKSWPAASMDAKPDANDTFYNVSLDLDAGAVATIGTGNFTFAGFSAADPLSIRFDELSTKP